MTTAPRVHAISSTDISSGSLILRSRRMTPAFTLAIDTSPIRVSLVLLLQQQSLLEAKVFKQRFQVLVPSFFKVPVIGPRFDRHTQFPHRLHDLANFAFNLGTCVMRPRLLCFKRRSDK